jgi:hypothetical protein
MKIPAMLSLSELKIEDDMDDPIEESSISLVPKTIGPRRLLMNILKQDPAMNEVLKKLRMKGNFDGSMGASDFEQS